MAGIYGQQRWLGHAPLTVTDDAGVVILQGVEHVWADVLGQRTLEDIARGIVKLEQTPGQFPPGAAEFNRLCREYQPGQFSGAAAPEVEEGALIGHDRANAKAEAAETLARIRERLSNQRPAAKMAQTIEARMDLLHESRATAIAYLRTYPVRWLADLDSDERIAALAVLDEHVTEHKP